MPQTKNPEKETRTLKKDFLNTEQKRFLSLQAPDKRELVVDEEARTVELAFSSENPYRRWFGDEILDHSDGAINFERLRSGGALLMDHNWEDQIGVVESVRIDSDRIARAVVRFSRSARGQEVFQDVIDGIRSNVSVGYFVDEMRLEGERDGIEEHRVTKWTPFEISLVSVPADWEGSGVGRSVEPNTPEPEATEEPPKAEERDAEELENLSDAVDLDPEDAPSLEDEVESETTSPERSVASDNQPTFKESRSMPTENTQDLVTQERQRVAELTEIGDKFGAVELARKAIAEGSSVADLNAAILESRGYEAKPAEGTTELGLTDNEKRSFSIRKLLNAQANPKDAKAQREAAFELEVTTEAARKSHKDVKGALVPFEVLAYDRSMSAGSAVDGGNLIATDLLTGSFIDMLQNRLSIFAAGATMLTGLEGNIAIPRQTGGASTYWIGENGQASESSATFDQIAMTPKTIAAYTEISRKLLQQQGVASEMFVQNELIKRIALGIDLAALDGTGTSNQPLGLLRYPGIGSVEMGTNGGQLTFGKAVDLETQIAVENADVGSMAYLTNVRVRGAAKQTERFAGTGQTIWSEGGINSYPAIVSNQVPSNGTKGTGTDLSTLLFGNFSDLIIGMWGGLDLQVNPYSLDTTGAVRVTSFQDVDTQVRHPESFAAIRDIVA